MQVVEKPVTWAQERIWVSKSSPQRLKRVLSTLSYMCVCVCVHIHEMRMKSHDIHFVHSYNSIIFDSAKVAENPLLSKTRTIQYHF